MTVIRYTLSVISHTTLKVYNVVGQQVDVLVNEVKPPGTYAVNFDASHLPSGVYFYRLQTQTQTLTKKPLKFLIDSNLNTFGQEVATLVQGEQNAGWYEVSLDASGFSTGIYLYCLQANRFVEARKMLLAK
jgi:hypothetical protein